MVGCEEFIAAGIILPMPAFGKTDVRRNDASDELAGGELRVVSVPRVVVFLNEKISELGAPKAFELGQGAELEMHA